MSAVGGERGAGTRRPGARASSLICFPHGGCRSLLAVERPPTGFSDPDANDPDRLAASFDGLPLCCCKPGVDEAGEQITGEAVGEQQRLGEAALVDGEQFQRLARFQAETAFSKGRRHREVFALPPIATIQRRSHQRVPNSSFRRQARIWALRVPITPSLPPWDS